MKKAVGAFTENIPEYAFSRQEKTGSGEISCTEILENLKEVHKAALISENFTAALRAIELQGKVLGLFSAKQKKHQKSLEEMNEEELLTLLNQSASSSS